MDVDPSRPCGVSHIAVVTGDLDTFRAFYEDVIGLRTTVVFGAGPGHAREAIMVVGADTMLQVFELAGDDAVTPGPPSPMFGRGRLDHIGFTVAGLPALHAMRDRLLAAGASSGDIRPLGPMLSLRFIDPDGQQGEINCYNPEFDSFQVRGGDEIVDPDWIALARRVLLADVVPGPTAKEDPP